MSYEIITDITQENEYFETSVTNYFFIFYFFFISLVVYIYAYNV